ncbi:MAG: fused MFS/spermidine synthase [Gammaproteobacteria bacterium]|nr:fused MFS/spermidine synthase [Gammaproteobacteria bacterium]MCF6260822.1 fused MFS/spermidine synthase [Gammaproteobacteria bacterium]
MSTSNSVTAAQASDSNPHNRAALLAIYFLFSLSGFVALIYEGIWARYLKLFLGHSSYGQILTLCIFMGGIGLGALIAARYTKQLKNPFLIYALVELVVGIGGFFYHDIYVFCTGLFYDNVSGMAAPVAESLKVIISVLITAPMAILLGTTFPLLGVAMVRISRDGGQSALPLLYFTNSIGAAVGIMLASYILIPQLGTAGSLYLAALGNVVIALGFYVIGRQQENALGQSGERFCAVEKPPLLQHEGDQKVLLSVKLFLALSLLTGFASFIYEISWIRLLSLLLGASTHSFDIMVSAFVLGLAFGGLAAKKLLQKTKHVVILLAIAQVVMGGLALTSIYFYEFVFSIMEQSKGFLDKTEQGYWMFTLLKYGLSLFLMFPATFIAGMTLPIITYYLMNVTRNEKYVGAVYGYNTIGAILGATLAGLVLLPLLQLKMTIASGAIIDIGIGLFLLWLYQRSRQQGSQAPLITATIVSVLMIMPLLFVSFNPNVIAAGYFRRTAFVMPDEKVTVRDGKTATISLHEIGDIKLIKTNGKTDAAVGGTKGEETQAALAFLPMSMIEQPYDAAIIGLGSGMTAHYMLGDSLLQSMDLIEIEEEMVNLAREMMPHNRRVYEDPRVNMVIDDARTFFSTSGKQYDVIVSEPSNPWVSGVSSLFSKEFYAHSKRYLKPDGILVQWMHLPEFNSQLMLTIIKALNSAFPHIKVYYSPYAENDVLIVASGQDFNADKYTRFYNNTNIAADFRQMRKPFGHYSNRNYIANINTLKLLSQDAQPNSDYIPLVDTGAEKAFFLRQKVDLFDPLTNSIVAYQELTEPESYPQILRERYAYYRNYRPDQRLLGQLAAQLTNADRRSNWSRLESMLYQSMPAPILRDLWPKLDVVTQFRQHVESGTPPEKTRLFFQFMDNVAQNRFAQNGPVIRGILQNLAGQKPGPVIIRALAVNAAMLKDKALYDQVIAQLVTGNADVTPIEKAYLTALQSQWFM